MGQKITFATYGPFTLRDVTLPSCQDLFRQVAKASPQLHRAIGVYIFSATTENNKLIPWYVGKTDSGFGKRLTSHLRRGKFNLLSGKGPLSLLLIARVTPKGKFKRFTKMESQKRGLASSRRLEWSLIGSCLSKNCDLMNDQGKRFHELLEVPGYWNSKAKKSDSAARALAEMLAT